MTRLSVPMRERLGRWLSLAACLLGVLLIVHTGWNWWSGRSLGRTIRSQTAAGLPMSLRAVLPEPIPDAHNAAVPLVQAFALMTGKVPESATHTPSVIRTLSRYRFGDEQVSDAYPLEDLDAEGMAELGRLLDEPCLAPVFGLLEAAAMGEPAQFARDYKFNTRHHPALRAAHHLLCLRAWLHARRGQPSQACRDVVTALYLVRGLSLEPTLVSHRIRAMADRKALARLQEAFETYPPRAFDSRLLWRVVGLVGNDRGQDLDGLLRALDGERVILGRLFLSLLVGGAAEETVSETVALPNRMRLYGSYLYRPLLKSDAEAFLLRMEAYREAAADVDITALRTLSGQVPPGIHPITRAIEPLVTATWRDAVNWNLDMQVSALAVKLVLHHQLNGNFPASLSGLAGGGADVIYDMLGNPIVYHCESGRFTVYSEGLDGRDDNGSPEQDNAWWFGSRRKP